jgi:hypothetical protein
MNFDSQITLFSYPDQHQKQGSGESIISGIHKSTQCKKKTFVKVVYQT